MTALELSQVEVRGLGKVFGAVAALRGVDLSLHAGEATVVVGPNGAGKSTLLSIVATLMAPTAGEVLYGGMRAKELGPALRRLIGFAGEEPQGYGELTGRENLLFRARLFRLDRPRERVDEQVEALGLDLLAGRAVSGYSQGERRRFGLAGALLTEPRLLLLDEPSSGLDGSGSARLLELLRGMLEGGAIVALSTHDPWLAAGLGDRVVELAAGRVLRDESAPSGEDRWRVLLSGEGR